MAYPNYSVGKSLVSTHWSLIRLCVPMAFHFNQQPLIDCGMLPTATSPMFDNFNWVASHSKFKTTVINFSPLFWGFDHQMM